MSGAAKPLTLFTAPLTTEQAEKLRSILARGEFDFEPKPYTLYYAKKAKLNIAVYEKGPKIVVQGKGTGEFIEFTLEPEILGAARLGYEEAVNPEIYEPHFGIDESGKGDFFGPLVIAGAYVNADIARELRGAGVQDSKKIGSDARIRSLARAIRQTRGILLETVVVAPPRYNDLFEKIGNLNRLLAWGHARVIENLAKRQPDCPRALSDQFANPKLIERALMKSGQSLKLEQRTKAESDLAVAAASIIARERFIDWMDQTGQRFGVKLPRGASAQVKAVARDLVAAHSPSVLHDTAKTHFKTAAEVLAPRD